ncbi:MAG TPA: macro domain-containing protein [Coriobacteriia bacterium]|nr:macro domain-containing protein [Coriobacteriia bacterium]
MKKNLSQYELFHGYRTAIQVCPRGCGFHERARRDLIVRTGLSGKAKVIATNSFETSNCPQDGAKLVSNCARCERPVFAPVVDRCQFCGVPQPWAKERRAGVERSSLRRWRPEPDSVPENERQVHDPAELLYTSKVSLAGGNERRADVWVLDGDIVRLAVDAVVSNDDVDGQMWSQSARSIKDVAGEGVERLAQEGKPFRLGHAWVTTAGDLRQMKGIIHVASMSRYGKSSIDTVRKCLVAAFRLAAHKEYTSVGLTAFGTAPATIKMHEWFEVFAETTVDFLSDPERQDERPADFAIVLALLGPQKLEKNIEELRGAFHDAWVKAGEPASGKPEPLT